MYAERVLVLVPHPDDEVVGTATALARLRQRGGEAFALYLTSGVPAAAGSWLGGRLKYPRSVARRWNEALNVSEGLGLRFAARQQIPSRMLKTHLESSISFAHETAENVEADCIWVPAYEGGHQDHDVTNFVGACLAESFEVWEFAEYNFANARVQSQTFIENNGSESVLNLDANEQASKRELLGRYASEQKNLGYVEMEREAFRPLADYDYTRAPHTGKMFYQRFQWVPYHPRIDYCRPKDVCHAIQTAVEGEA